MKRKIGKALVVGAGISGIRASLDMAETGYQVVLIDRAPHLGGVLSQLDYQFPTNRCGMCKMLPLVERDSASQFCLRKGLFHENIDIRLATELTSVSGEPGHFQATLRQAPTWVDPERCVGCGICESVCPVEVPDAFNQGLSTRKAIYLPVPHTIPNPYIIDLAACTRCGECEAVCPTDAVRLSTDQRQKFRILVVDDELIVRDSLKALLEDEGFSAETAGSGPEALEMLGQLPFNLMLTDIKMPGMEGVEVLEKARAAFPELAVLMMTAYATVDTAVEAMKIGALDYLVKPFDPDTLIPKIIKVYQDLEAAHDLQLEVGAIVLCGGTDYFRPEEGKDVYGYGRHAGVVTTLEFERILSGTGPCQGQLVRPGDGRPIKKIAWLQCVGSRDLQTGSDFCSSICCMVAVKEAMIVKERAGADVDTAIFYMDMRTYAKPFQRYRDRAETEAGVRFERGRVHSVAAGDKAGDLVVRCAGLDGSCSDERFDLVVLAVGQRPSQGTGRLAEMAGIDLNPWGFVKTAPFFDTCTSRDGIFCGGSFSGLKDIGESVIHASAAATEAVRVIHAAGGSLADASAPEAAYRDVSREPPRAMVVVCTCGESLRQKIDLAGITRELEKDPVVVRVVSVERACTADGWTALAEMVGKQGPNRIVIAACHTYLFLPKLREMGRRLNLNPALMEVVDLARDLWGMDPDEGRPDGLVPLRMALARLKRAEPTPVAEIPVSRRALIVGGGIAGMTAALAIGDQGFPVDLIEQRDALGGNLSWLHQTADGQSPGQLLTATAARVEKHPQVTVHTHARVVGSYGQVGRFATSVENGEGVTATIEHGVTIFATGGSEAPAAGYGYDESPAVVTQKELEEKFGAGDPALDSVTSVVMIQCVGSRQEPRNYCSRVCCTASLKHALALKEKNPDVGVYILYRDIMTYGFSETYFTRARQAGVIFIQYTVDNPPRVTVSPESGEAVQVEVFDPILGFDLQIMVDLLVLATGIVPSLPADLGGAFGAELDRDGFFKEAESKWRPLDALKEGVFACGLALSPRSIPETVATAEAAAQRCLRILARERLPGSRVVAEVHESLCALCERCIETCPYGARLMDPDRTRVTVNPAMCQGCGACAAICPNGASVLRGFSEPQMLEVIDAALS